MIRKFHATLLLLMLAACGPSVNVSGTNTYDKPAPDGAKAIPASTGELEPYIVAPNDEVIVDFSYNPELNRRLRVRPDGYITVPIKGDVKAAGHTPKELSNNISGVFGDTLQRADVTVTVTEATGNQIYIMGAVRNPGFYPLLTPVTSLQSLSLAGGFQPEANLSSVLVITRDAENRPVGKVIDLKEVLATGDTSSDIMLRRYDVVFVPRTGLALAALVGDNIRRMIPISFNATYNLQESVHQ